MKIIATSFLTLLFILCAFATFAQPKDYDKSAAWALVQKNAAQLGIAEKALSNLKVTQSFTDQQTGGTYIYLQHTLRGIPIHNQIVVLSFKNGVNISRAGNMHSWENVDGSEVDIPALRAEAAIITAAAHVKAATPVFESPGMPMEDGRLNYGHCNIAYEDVTAQLFWVPVVENGKTKLVLAWQVNIAPNKTTDFWSVRVNAFDMTVIGKNNFTVYEQYDGHNHSNETHETNGMATLPGPAGWNKNASAQSSLLVVNNASYNVIAYPLEAPSFGAATLENNAWNLAGSSNPNAVTLKWHSDGTTDWDISRGNNVWATEDRGNTGNNTGLPASSSTTPDPLTFNTTPNYTVVPTDPTFQQFAITNLFYWNNISHDLAYNYGFTEATGNFQVNNLGRGGTGNDDVKALAQSGAGTNNANFLTPPDGSRPRMRMYIWTPASPDRDSDLDNGVITHEYAHGISNRLTGGISGGGGCLTNAEQAGEGWSDYFALMLTTNWATAQLSDGFTKPRGVGTYLYNQAPTGAGIRNYRYCTDMAVNALTYAYMNSGAWGEVHNIGEIWCATLWDMTWNIIQTNGINTNLFNASATGGNTIALRLVMEGMKLQPCSPGFLDARDGILAADQLLYGGQYRCQIMNAFARRGMGFDAKQGSSGSTGDQVAGFSTKEANLSISQSVQQQSEGNNVTYTHTVIAGQCSAIANFLITDTLPSTVTYVSGGTYNPANRVVSFNVSQAAGSTQTYSFTVSINTGTYYPTVNLFEDAVPSGTLPNANFTATSTTTTNWAITNLKSHSAPSSYYSASIAVPSDQKLTGNNAIAMGSNPSKLYFWHFYNAEGTYDGGVLEVSTDNGTNWSDIGNNNFIRGGYNGTFDASVPVGAGRRCWTGSNSGFTKVVVDMAPYVNQSIKLRYRFLSDNGTSVEGWYVDDISLITQSMVDIKAQIFNDAGVKLGTTDTFTIILPGTCVAAAINGQPSSATACSGTSVTYTVSASGTAPNYQWQVSTSGGCGGNFVSIPGANAASYTVTGINATMNGYAYRVMVSNTCGGTLTSQCALLTVTPGTEIITHPSAASGCEGTNLSFNTVATGTGLTYNWQYSTNGGATWNNFSPAQTATTFTWLNVPAGANGNLVRVQVSGSGTCAVAVNSNTALVTVTAAPSITAQPSNVTTCPNTSVNFTAGSGGTNVSMQWQVSTSGCGGTFTNISGATANTLALSNVSASMNGYAYRLVVSNSCGTVNTNCVVLNVNADINIMQQPASTSGCIGTNALFTATASGTGLLYQWQVSTNNGATFANIAGANSSTLSVPITSGVNGNVYRVLVTGTCNTTGTYTNTAVLTALNPPVVNASPVSISKCVNNTASFTVNASATGLALQWQVSNDGGATWANIAGANVATYTIPSVTLAQNGNRYRAIVNSSDCGSVISASALLTVTNPPVVALSSALGTVLNPTATTVLTATVSPSVGNYSYQWYYNGNAVAGSGATRQVTIDDLGKYKVTVTDVTTGCTATSSDMIISAAVDNALFIYPSPTDGLFHVRYYNEGGGNVTRTLSVFDSRGARVINRAFTIGGAYPRMDETLANHRSGVYLVVISGADGKKIASGKIYKK